MNLLTLSLIAFTSLAGVSAVTGIVYRLFLQPLVLIWFGDEPGHRWSRETQRRRRNFERTCGSAIACMWFSVVIGTVRLLVAEPYPELSRIALFAQLGLIAVMYLLIWAAVSQWNEPFAN